MLHTLCESAFKEEQEIHVVREQEQHSQERNSPVLASPGKRTDLETIQQERNLPSLLFLFAKYRLCRLPAGEQKSLQTLDLTQKLRYSIAVSSNGPRVVSEANRLPRVLEYTWENQKGQGDEH